MLLSRSGVVFVPWNFLSGVCARWDGAPSPGLFMRSDDSIRIGALIIKFSPAVNGNRTKDSLIYRLPSSIISRIESPPRLCLLRNLRSSALTDVVSAVISGAGVTTQPREYHVS